MSRGCGKTLQAEAKSAKLETVTKEKNEDNETVYRAKCLWAAKRMNRRRWRDGTLTEINLAVDDEDLPLDRCPAIVQATFRSEAYGEKIDAGRRDMKYGLTVYQTVVDHKGKVIRDRRRRGRDPGGKSSRH